MRCDEMGSNTMRSNAISSVMARDQGNEVKLIRIYYSSDVTKGSRNNTSTDCFIGILERGRNHQQANDRLRTSNLQPLPLNPRLFFLLPPYLLPFAVFPFFFFESNAMAVVAVVMQTRKKHSASFTPLANDRPGRPVSQQKDPDRPKRIKS
ncbi:hypothetical protein GGI42DRAFT_316651 [Trichoderma sp. SZMC 28013]